MNPATVAASGWIRRPKRWKARAAAAQQAIATSELPRSATPLAIEVRGASTTSTCTSARPRNTPERSSSRSALESAGLGVASTRVARKASAADAAAQAATRVGPSRALARPKLTKPMPPAISSEPISRWMPKRTAAAPSRRWVAPKPKTQAFSAISSPARCRTTQPTPTTSMLAPSSSSQEAAGSVRWARVRNSYPNAAAA